MKVFIGIMMMLASLWGGSWLIIGKTVPQWADFPTAVTAVLVFFLGAVFSIASID